MEDLEPECATTESTASKEGKDGMSSGTGNVQWDDVEKCTEGMAPCEKGKVDPSTGDMDASILFLRQTRLALSLGVKRVLRRSRYSWSIGAPFAVVTLFVGFLAVFCQGRVSVGF